MGILGIGVDVLHVERLAALITRRGSSRLASRILSTEEQIHWESLPSLDSARRLRFLAVRWAVKEAAYKALYPAVCPTWKELTYRGLDTAQQKPVLVYRPAMFADDLDAGLVKKIHASVSHDGEYVFTTVIVETANDDFA